MKVIDFDEKFRLYLEKWLLANRDRYKDADALEAAAPGVYDAFIRQDAPWLNGLTPQAYFDALTDPLELTQALKDYEDAGVSPPDLLLERIVALGKPAVEPLLSLLRDERLCPCLRVTAANLLLSLEAEEAEADCLALVEARAEEDELADAAADLLEVLGPGVAQKILPRLEGASPAALSTWLDILCNFPGDERIYQYMVKAFMNTPEKRALYAALLGKLGDERAVEPLTRMMRQSDLKYLDYLEIANAIEMLGGDPGARDREFAGDPDYEALKNLE